MGDPERVIGPTQVRIIEAAFKVWEAEPPSVLFGGLTVSRVAKQAGVTRATFYSYWPSMDDYLVDLLEYLPSLDPDGYRPEAQKAMRQLHSANAQTTRDLYRAADQQLTAISQDPAFRLRLAFLSKLDDPTVASRLRERYRIVEERTAAFGTVVRESWGREIRPPLTEAQLQGVYTAIFEGFAIRHMLDPDLLPADLYGRVVLAFTMSLTRRTDDPRTLDDVLDSANTWPAVGMRLRNRAAGTGTPANQNRLDREAARQVVVQARRLQASMSWHELTLADIANVTGVSEEVLIRGFGSKAGLAMAIFMLNVHERYDALEPGSDPATDLRNMIAAGFAELRRAPGLSQNVLQVLAGSSLPVADIIDWNPILMLAEQIERTQQAGLMRSDLDPHDLAMTINRLQMFDTPIAGDLRPGTKGMVEVLLLGAGLEPAPLAATSPPYVPRADDDEPRPDPFVG